ncbi:cell division protein [Paenibacillus sp. FSL R7-0273]|uniref:bactofilin family protein n=1 Tax=Paenibacillus sp. FSL R7-0273 TaxID=1536772 RepID=UPI0004F7D677|nr:polymer-forming cytoskeletal protein [Paenibacillus sp. FSL R7-0273]AIQ45288.1 cell division protein [Paenibacillus sp. FSL R7-0273]OMF88908.1 cell division protein [Paenibacillus sp. FSL R7-0273]
MWGRRKQVAPFRSTDSLIGHGGNLEGKVQCDTNLRIEGNFSGEIQCQGTVTVGEQGTVRSSIKAKAIIIAGKVYGDVTADQRLTMTETGQLHGNIMAGTLSIMEGSVLNGSIATAEPAAPPSSESRTGAGNASSADKAAKRAAKQQAKREAG